MPTSPECELCLLKGIHSRVKRAYYRIGGKYHEIGWICPTCFHFRLDREAYQKELRASMQITWEGIQPVVNNGGERIFHSKSEKSEKKSEEKN